MRRYHESFIDQVRDLRKKELLSFSALGKKYGIPSSTIRNWCHGMEINKRDTLLRYYEQKRSTIKNSELGIVNSYGSLNRQQSMFIASILYGCEGAKYPASNCVSFANSDPYLILTFLRLLQKSFALQDDKFTLHLQIHSNQNFVQLKKYWSKLLGISEGCFIKPTITVPTGRKHRNNYQGTCTLRYRDYKIQLKLLGVFETFVQRFDNPRSQHSYLI